MRGDYFFKIKYVLLLHIKYLHFKFERSHIFTFVKKNQLNWPLLPFHFWAFSSYVFNVGVFFLWPANRSNFCTLPLRFSPTKCFGKFHQSKNFRLTIKNIAHKKLSDSLNYMAIYLTTWRYLQFSKKFCFLFFIYIAINRLKL